MRRKEEFKGLSKKVFITFFLLSFVSLFADVTYEGARSVLGAYFNILGATAFIVGFIGIGELVNYIMRGLGGLIAGHFRSSKIYWGLVIAGYFVNLVAVPLLSFAGTWQLALILVLLERAGKGLRAPARDVIVAELTEPIGKGKGFGIHEVLDQIGAVAGPAFVAWSLAVSYGNYRLTLLYLAIPAFIALMFVITASIIYPKIKSVSAPEVSKKHISKKFLLYLASMASLTLGFVHWALISYHLKVSVELGDYAIPLFYTLAMLVDAIIAFPIGYIYDKVGLKALAASPILVFASTSLLLFTNTYIVTLLVSIWGIVMGMYETVMRAAIADLVKAERRAYAYGIFGLTMGSSWMIGNIVLGFLYQFYKYMVPCYVLVMEVLSALLLIKIIGK